ncbi:MAG: site-2 protease family protein [Bdellovibrionales bacterium]|nr:site-2 protease family protein [Bdellovibrionales bacterium]
MFMAETASRVLMYFVPFLFALCFHEYAHGWVARLKGDRTAELMGRLTLNPMAHLDPIGTVLLPILALVFKFPFFGWARPVPINERNLKNPRKDMFWIALAGPLSNIFLAILATFALVLLHRFQQIGGLLSGAKDLLQVFLIINLFLAVFNLIPLHPLDGGKVLARFLPEHLNRTLEASQSTTSIILILLMASGAFSYLAVPVYMTAEFLLHLASSVAG